MEQDNKKLRDKAKRERNEEVRVSFNGRCFIINVPYWSDDVVYFALLSHEHICQWDYNSVSK